MTLRSFLAAFILLTLGTVNKTPAAEPTDFALKGQWLSDDVNGPAGPSRTQLDFVRGGLLELRVLYLAPVGELTLKAPYTLEGRQLRTELLNTGEPVEIIVLDADTICFGGSHLKDLTFRRVPAEAKTPSEK